MGIPAAIPYVMAGLGMWGSQKEGQRADQLNAQAQQQIERDYADREPLRKLGMQALGQIERPMDLGNLGFDSANPYAAARGPSPSTASYGNWGEMTYDPSADPNRTQRVMGEQKVEQARTGLEGLRMQIPDRLRAKANASLDREQQRLQGLQPMGSPFGFER